MGNEALEDLEAKRRHLQEVNGTPHKRQKTSKDTDGKGLILKMSFPNFEKNSIYSVDVHPDGTSFAAGGVGDESAGRIVIWQIVSFKHDKPELRVISQMDNHSVCTNCVRWSHKGNYLASGANDNLVMIWQPVLGTNSENWRCVHVLRCHGGDVLSVAWSPNDAMLASCSVDNTVVVWNAENTFQQLIVLRDCQSLVKGVTWDPIGKYLAAQDDKSLRIWRTSDWKQEQVLHEYFDKGDSCTQVLRLDWSSDGMHIVSAHASNQGRPIAQIIERNSGGGDGGWKSPFYLAGHSRPVVCVRFNPRMFVASSQENAPYCVCATGGRDHTISVWNFKHKRPHCFTGLFSSPVMDVTWLPDGMSLLACSMDGSVALIRCGVEILGHAISKEQQAQTLTKLYGKLGVESTRSFVGSHNIVESSVFLDAQEVESKGRKDKDGGVGNKSGISGGEEAEIRLPYEGIPLTEQIEVRLPNGKRKITPIFIPETPISNLASIPSCSLGNDERSQSSSVPHEAFKNPEEPPAVPAMTMARPLAPAPLKATSRNNNLPPKRTTVESPPERPLDEPEKKKKFDKDAFTLISSKINGSPDRPRPKKKKVKTAAPEAARNNEEDSQVEPVAPPPPKNPAPILNGVLKKSKPKPPKTAVVENGQLAKETTVSITPSSSTAQHHQPTSSRRTAHSTAARRIAAPLVQSSLVHILSEKMEEAEVMLVVENDVTSAPSSRLHKVQLLIGEVIAWVQYLYSPVTLLTANAATACTVCEDLSVVIWCCDSGARLYETLLPSAGCFVACARDALLVVTADARASMWHRSHKLEIWRRIDLGSVEGMLRTSSGVGSVVDTAFTETHVPVISTSDHRHFVCDVENASWVIAHDENVRFGNYILSKAGLSQNVPDLRGPLAKLQKSRSTVTVGSHVSPEIARIMAFGFMEKQMLLSRLLKSPTEYQGWLKCYAQSLVDFESLPRLRALLDSLLGPHMEDVGDTCWSPEVLGLQKRGLLEKILPLLARKTQFQRVYTEYRQLLELSSRNIFAVER